MSNNRKAVVLTALASSFVCTIQHLFSCTLFRRSATKLNVTTVTCSMACVAPQRQLHILTFHVQVPAIQKDFIVQFSVLFLPLTFTLTAASCFLSPPPLPSHYVVDVLRNFLRVFVLYQSLVSDPPTSLWGFFVTSSAKTIP
jgi:hypothetical protein